MKQWYQAVFQPTPKLLRYFMKEHGLTGVDVGRLVNKDPRNVRRWTSEEPNEPNMPHAEWYTLVHKVTRRKVDAGKDD